MESKIELRVEILKLSDKGLNRESKSWQPHDQNNGLRFDGRKFEMTDDESRVVYLRFIETRCQKSSIME